MNKKKKIAIVIIVLFMLVSCAYLLHYHKAQSEAIKYLNGSENVTVKNTTNGIMLDGKGNDTAIIFYPGAKVDYLAYLPLFSILANDEGYDCFLVNMPFNFAFLAPNSADEIIKNTNYSNYFMAGHSLGGAMASSYENSTNKTDGLIFLAAYPMKDIYKPCLFIRGTNDGILNLENYNNSKDLVKNNITEYIINGGNHGQYAYYGHQTGDSKASISAESQQNQTANEIIKFINGVIA